MNHDAFNPVHSGNQLNWGQVERYIREHIKGLGLEPMHVHPFSAGYSNLTFAIRIGDWEAVLRCPPLGDIPPKAHDMEREYRILQRLHPVFPLAPKPYILGVDDSVMARPFYLMERKVVVVLDDALPPPEYKGISDVGKLISQTVMETMVRLHAIDLKDSGLAEIGRTEGYLERQVNGWIKRYHESYTEEISFTGEIESWLHERIPASPAPTIVHNDFKLNNMMLSPDDPKEAEAVFDWEMCTVGDPLSDLGTALAYWTEKGEAFTGFRSVTPLPGFMTRRELVQAYAQKSGRDVSNIEYYLTFAFYKVAVILQQLYSRWLRGEVNDERFATLRIGIVNLMEQSYRTMRHELL